VVDVDPTWHIQSFDGGTIEARVDYVIQLHYKTCSSSLGKCSHTHTYNIEHALMLSW